MPVANFKKIIILDSDKVFSSSLGRLLKKQYPKASFLIEDNLPSGMALIDRIEPDLIISEWFFAEHSLAALLNEMASYADTVKLPKIILTAWPNRISLSDLRPFGVIAILDKKTYTAQQLFSIIDKLLVKAR